MRLSTIKRLTELERVMNPEQKAQLQDQYEEKLLEKAGITRQQVMEKYGGFPPFAYARMISKAIGPPKPIPPQFRDAQECYFAMIKGKA